MNPGHSQNYTQNPFHLDNLTVFFFKYWGPNKRTVHSKCSFSLLLSVETVLSVFWKARQWWHTALDASACDAEIGGPLWVRDQPGLQDKFQDYTEKPCHRGKKEKEGKEGGGREEARERERERGREARGGKSDLQKVKWLAYYSKPDSKSEVSPNRKRD